MHRRNVMWSVSHQCGQFLINVVSFSYHWQNYVIRWNVDGYN